MGEPAWATVWLDIVMMQYVLGFTLGMYNAAMFGWFLTRLRLRQWPATFYTLACINAGFVISFALAARARRLYLVNDTIAHQEFLLTWAWKLRVLPLVIAVAITTVWISHWIFVKRRRMIKNAMHEKWGRRIDD